jgi:hypothetical protein
MNSISELTLNEIFIIVGGKNSNLKKQPQAIVGSRFGNINLVFTVLVLGGIAIGTTLQVKEYGFMSVVNVKVSNLVFPLVMMGLRSLE